jgi:hypothetical protein
MRFASGQEFSTVQVVDVLVFLEYESGDRLLDKRGPGKAQQGDAS